MLRVRQTHAPVHQGRPALLSLLSTTAKKEVEMKLVEITTERMPVRASLLAIIYLIMFVGISSTTSFFWDRGDNYGIASILLMVANGIMFVRLIADYQIAVVRVTFRIPIPPEKPLKKRAAVFYALCVAYAIVSLAASVAAVHASGFHEFGHAAVFMTIGGLCIFLANISAFWGNFWMLKLAERGVVKRNVIMETR